MTPRRWIATTLLFTLLLGAAVAVCNARADIYGLFRDTRGRRLPIYDSERRGKYLLSQHYVPENFDAILLGSSVTSTWDTGGIHAYRTYNESTDGGNITEMKLLAETVLRSPGLRLALLVVHPYMTDTHGLNADEMGSAEYWGALGSISLLRAYKLRFAVESGRDDLVWDDRGGERKNDAPAGSGLSPLNPVLRRIIQSEGDVTIDPVALGEYRDLIATLRARGVKLVAVVPPLYEGLLAPRRERFARYASRLLALFAPGDLVIDFNGPEFAAFRADPANFRDGVHHSRRGAAEIVRAIDARLRSWR